MTNLRETTLKFREQEDEIRAGTGESGQERQRRLGRLTARERVQELIDPESVFFEFGLWSAWKMYSEWGETPAAGVVAGIGRIHSRPVMIVANDATVKAGAFFPQSVKKVLRLQRIAMQLRLPLIYLVDSAGVFLPLQDEIFPDEDDFGRIFRNNAVISAMGIPQYSAVMGNCVAGGGYLPVLSDKLLMTEGSQLCLAGPALVKAAIGQTVDPDELGGARMHAELSGTVDFLEADDHACLSRLRTLVELVDDDRAAPSDDSLATERDCDDVFDIVGGDGEEYEVQDVIKCLIDADSLQEYKAEYGPTLVTSFAKIGGRPVGLVANQRYPCKTGANELQIGGVLYPDSVEKAARFVMDCNQTGLPLIFLQDVQGLMVGKQAEQSGIIRSGAKLVNVVSNSVVPKFTVIIGGSFGAGNYALCGKAYDPTLILAWPNVKYAVMGAAQAADTLMSLRIRDAERSGQTLSEDDKHRLRREIEQQYEQQTDIRYGAARGWVDAVIDPRETRRWLIEALRIIPKDYDRNEFRTGVLQV